jgi:hypothetical protein
MYEHKGNCDHCVYHIYRRRMGSVMWWLEHCHRPTENHWKYSFFFKKLA